jgi:DNA repair protein RadC
MSIKMKELPISERPYEKLEMYGASALSNAELLAIIIKTGTKEESSVTLAQKVLKLNKDEKDNLKFLQDISINELTKIKGIGKIKAIQIKAVSELTKRISRPIMNNKIKITCPQDVANLLIDELKNEKREKVKVLILNSKNIIIKILDVSYGGTNLAIVEPKDILSEVVKMEAPKIILIHNHPSGDPTPSKADMAFTDRLIEASKIIGIELLDHIVIGNESYESIFYRKGLGN